MTPVDNEALAGGEVRYVVLAKRQPQYNALPALCYPDGKVLTEWRLTEDERRRIAAGENIRLWTWTFGAPFQPIKIEVTSEDKA